MAATNLSPGTVKSMTRGAPEKGGPNDLGANAALSLMDKLRLLRLVAEEPPLDRSQMLDEIRRNASEGPSAVFGRLRDFVELRSL